jgi:hypothetical protein
MLKRLLTLITSFSLFFFILSICSGVSLYAQSETQLKGLVVSPAIQEIDAEKGDSYQIELNLRNDTLDKTYSLIHTTETFEASTDEGVPVLKEFSLNDPQKTWIGYPEPLLTLKPGESKTSFVTLSIPKDASPGGYYFALIVGETAVGEANSNKVLVNSRVGSLLFVNVLGKVEKEVSFENFKLDKQIYDPFFDSIDVEYKISIKGNTFLKPAGNIFFGTQDSSGAINLNPDGKIILPNSSRLFQVHIPATQSAGTELADYINNNSKKSFKGRVENINKPLFGQKDIEAKIVYTNSDQEVTQKIVKVNVIFFPWKTILLGIVVISLIGLIVFLIRKIVILKLEKKKNLSD